MGESVGINLTPAKHMMIEGRLKKRMRSAEFATLDAYCDWLFNGDGLRQELPHLINAVTTNKTDFFREVEHYHFLEQVVVPELLNRSTVRTSRLKLWSAASANGAEAYSAAMILEKFAQESRRLSYAVLGTDVSTEVLAQARRAVYSAEMMAPVPAHYLSRFVLTGKKPGARPQVRMAPELRRHMVFRYLNLMDKSYPIDDDVDVIFLRNVLIYFEKPVQDEVIARVTAHLRQGGYLMLGHSESMIGTRFPVTQVAPAIFRKN
ncbi:MAG: chemotaxis protein CheR [Alphaproteobacteria bacterium]|nr:chemotaxis protein CheR [Alphaproteobacteria bacterium]